MADKASTGLEARSGGNAPTLARIVQDKITAEISSGVFGPGMRLEEKELAVRYQVSRTPVREALRQLASMGMVDMRARKGVLVADMGAQRILHTLEVIADLEASCARYAAERMSAAQKTRLEAINGAIGAAAATGDATRFDQLNLDFHLLLHAGAGNEILSDAVDQMRARIMPYTRAEAISARDRLGARDQMSRSFREHETIVSAIVSGHGELAYHAMRAHVIAAGQAIEGKNTNSMNENGRRTRKRAA